jgi:hypothetical protein
MLKDVWDSFKDNIKERATNPFLGTFAIVWIIHNWQVVYSFFYFDKDWKLQQKINYFNNYWFHKSFFWSLVLVALITVGILIITYLFLGLSRLLANYFENVVIPFVYSLSRGKTVTAEVHQQTLEQVERWKIKFEEERKAKNEAQQERDELEKKLFKSKESSADTDQVNISRNFEDLIKKMLTEHNKKALDDALLFISKGSRFAFGDEIIDSLLKYGLIKLSRRDSYGNYYNFTEEGNEFRKQYFDSEF